MIIILVSTLAMPVISLGLVGVLTTIGVPREAVLLAVSFIPVLVVPAVVQPILFFMAINKEYRGFRIEALRPDSHHEDLTLTECIAPALMLWIVGSILLLILLIPIQLAVGALVGDATMNFAIAPAIQVLFAYPIALALLFRFHRARFHGFRLHTARDEEK